MASGLLYAALSGAGNSIAQSAAAEQKFMDEQSLMRERMALEEQKQIRIEERAEARRVAPMQRFSGLLNAKLSEDAPVTAEPVTRTTSEGAKAAGLQDGLVGMTREQVEAYKDPEMLAQYDRQIAADKRIAEEKVAGKTRKRTQDEAIKLALDEALATDPEAFAAGEALTKGDRKEALEEKKLKFQESKADRDREQRDIASQRQFEAMIARIEAATGGKSGNKTALIQNAEYLKTLGYSDDKIEKFIFEKKELPLEDVAAKILAGDPTMKPEDAAKKAISLRNALANPQKPIPDPDNRPSLESFMRGSSAAAKKPSREASGMIKY